MPDKAVQKIEGLKIGLACKETEVVFYFSGVEKAVREATRDACYGLDILEKIILEALCLEPEVPAALRSERLTYSLTISIHDFDILVLMHRYCRALGITFPGIPEEEWMTGRYVVKTRQNGPTIEEHLTLPQYMAEVAHVAACQADKPLIVSTDTKPPCSLLWTQEELEQEELELKNCGELLIPVEDCHNRRKLMDTFFKFHEEASEPSALGAIEARTHLLISRVDQLLRRHPAALFGIEGVAWNQLELWAQLVRRGLNPAALPDAFTRVRLEDMAAFATLAEEFTELQSLRHALTVSSTSPGIAAQ